MLGRLPHRHRVGAASRRVRFHAAYTIPDTATAALGVLVAAGVLATAGRTRRPAPPGEPAALTRRPP